MIKLKDILLKEALLKEVNVTPFQNQGMKIFYTLLRNTLKNIHDQCISNNITPETFPDFVFNKCKMPSYIRGKGKNYLALPIPFELQVIFPKLPSPIKIYFTPEGYAELSQSNYGKISGVIIPIHRMFGNFDYLETLLQHETQHLVSPGSSFNEKETNYLLKLLGYLGHPGEIEAHARQYAHLYFKSFPNDKKLDLQKFFSEIEPKMPDPQQNGFANYIAFGYNTKEVQDKYQVDNSVVLRMKNTYKSLIENMEYFFQLFKQRIS